MGLNAPYTIACKIFGKLLRKPLRTLQNIIGRGVFQNIKIIVCCSPNPSFRMFHFGKNASSLGLLPEHIVSLISLLDGASSQSDKQHDGHTVLRCLKLVCGLLLCLYLPQPKMLCQLQAPQLSKVICSNSGVGRREVLPPRKSHFSTDGAVLHEWMRQPHPKSMPQAEPRWSDIRQEFCMPRRIKSFYLCEP